MLNLVIKDVLIQKKSLLIALFYIIFFVFVFQSIGPVMFTTAIVAFSYILVMGAFAYDDKNKADIMINSLPVRRVNVVTAKYITLFMYLAIGTLAYTAAYYIVPAVNSSIKVYPVTVEGIVGAIVGISLMNSIYFPLIFKIGYTRAKVINMFIFFAFFFGVPSLVNLVYANKNSGFIMAVTDFFNNQPDVVTGLIILAAVSIMLIMSYMLSLKFYKKREF